MIQVTRLDGSKLHVNAELIRFIESTPDTVISLSDGVKLVVREKPETVVDEVVAYQRRIHSEPVVQREAA